MEKQKEIKEFITCEAEAVSIPKPDIKKVMLATNTMNVGHLAVINLLWNTYESHNTRESEKDKKNFVRTQPRFITSEALSIACAPAMSIMSKYFSFFNIYKNNIASFPKGYKYIINKSFT